MSSPLTVTVITDTHYYSKKLGTSGAAYEIANNKSGVLLAEAAEMLEAAFAQIAKDDRTDIVLLSGDTTSNGDFDSHYEFIEMLRNLKAKGKRVYYLCMEFLVGRNLKFNLIFLAVFWQSNKKTVKLPQI